MTWSNYTDCIHQLQSIGLLLDTAKRSHGGAIAGEVYVDSIKPIRVKVDGGGREERGWYWLQEKEIRGQRYLTGGYGVWEGASNQKYAIKITLEGKPVQLSEDERAAIKARHAENLRRAQHLRKQEADRAAHKARLVWAAYVATGQSEYLKRKAVGAHGLRFDPNGAGTVAVPMLRHEELVGLQIIRGPNRGKKLEKEYFPAGMDKVGAFHTLGRIVPRGVVVIAEGYATAASIFEALGQTVPVAVAFDAGSLMAVASAIAKQFRGVKILVAADDDHVQKCKACGQRTDIDIERCQHCGNPHEKVNPGVEAARNTAHAVGGSWLKPDFNRPEIPPESTTGSTPKGDTDFNDLHVKKGLFEVRAQVGGHLDRLGWSTQQALSGKNGATPSEGAGGPDVLPGIVDCFDAMERYSLVYAGKGTLFDHQEHQLVAKSDVMDVLKKGAWNDIKFRGGLPVVRLEEVGFDPAENDPAITCNLWRGWPTKPKAGTCEAILSLLEHLCSGEDNPRDLCAWVLKWLAYPLQHPGAKMKTALIFHGPQGVGKNLFFEAIMAIYGEYGRVVDQSAIEDKFNDWASRKLFLIADEVVTRAEIWHVKNKLKHFVTGDTIRINPKNVAAYTERNHVNVVYLSNEKQPLPLEKDDRRHCVVWTPEKLSEWSYTQVVEEIRAGGVAALHHHLLHLDLGDFNEHSKPPMTLAKTDLIDVSLESTERFLRDWQAGDIELGRDEDGQPRRIPFCPCNSGELYSVYKRWCVNEGITRPREQSTFLNAITKMHGWSRGHKDIHTRTDYIGPTKRARMVVPSIAALTEAAKRQDDTAKRAGRANWLAKPEQTQAQWLTDCFFAFRNALPGTSRDD